MSLISGARIGELRVRMPATRYLHLQKMVQSQLIFGIINARDEKYEGKATTVTSNRGILLRYLHTDPCLLPIFHFLHRKHHVEPAPKQQTSQQQHYEFLPLAHPERDPCG